MKLLVFSCLFARGMLPAQAGIDPVPADGEWSAASIRAQSQFAQHKFAEAEGSSKQALRIAKRFGDSDERVAMSYYQLGNIYRDWGHCGAARSSYSRSIAIWEKHSGTRPAYILNSILGLLGTLCECDQLAAAEKTFRSYEASLKSYQSDPIDESHVLSIRAAIARARKDYPRAETYYRHAFELLRQAPDSTPLQIEQERGNLAAVIDKQGRHAEALALFEREIEYFERSTTSNPVPYLTSLNNAACTLADLGRREEAGRMLERALAGAREAFGEDTRFTAKVMLNYARVLRENKDRPAAEAMQKKGDEAFRRALVRDNSVIDLINLR